MALPYILKYIAEGEHQHQDFKMRIDDSKKIARTLAAFANTEGGRLLIGVKDNGNISGVNVEEEFHMIEAAAQMYCKPEIEFETQVWKVEYKSVLEVNILPSAHRPHSAITDEGGYRPFLRERDQVFPAPAVLLEVWKHSANDRPQKYLHTPKEKKIFTALEEKPGLSLSQLSRITGIARNILTTILARLIRWNLVALHFEQATAKFTLK